MYTKIQMNSLHEISRAADNVHRTLADLRDQALTAMRKMEEGKALGGFGGPISHQTPSDLERYAERLACKMQTAQALKVDQEHIQWAHDMGVADMMSPYHEELWTKIAALADKE